MSRPKGGLDGRIIEAATHLFSHEGFRGTTTREIARRADVNEASLFRYFPRKQDLFWAALGSSLKRLRLRKELLRGLAQGGKPDLVLPLIIELLVDTTNYHPELIRLLNVGHLELRPGTERMYREHLAPIFDAISNYLTRCVENGEIRSLDPSITAVAFVTTIVGHQSLSQLLTGNLPPYASTEEATLAYSRYWVDLLAPSAAVKAAAMAFSAAGPGMSSSLPIMPDRSPQK